MPPDTATLEADLAALVGAEHVRAATPDDAVAGVAPHLVVAPGDAGEVARVLRLANDAGLAVAPVGGGTKLGWGNPPRRLDVALSLARLARVVEHAWGDMTATAQAGCAIASMQAMLAQHGQRLALDPLWPDRATLGGVVATNDSGALRLRYGTARDMLLGVMVALPDGTLAKSGGKVVKNVAGYDLPKLMIGALGTLGIVVEATVRLYPLPHASRDLWLTLATVEAAQRAILRLLDAPAPPVAAQLMAQSDGEIALALRVEGVPDTLEGQAARFADIVGVAPTEPPAGIWRGREELFALPAPRLVLKVSVKPSRVAALIDLVTRAADSRATEWRLVAQAAGVGFVGLATRDDERAIAVRDAIVAGVDALGGTCVTLDCPPASRQAIDVWHARDDALPLMRRVKSSFDSRGTLNPGRFVGHI